MKSAVLERTQTLGFTGRDTVCCKLVQISFAELVLKGHGFSASEAAPLQNLRKPRNTPANLASLPYAASLPAPLARPLSCDVVRVGLG